MTEEVDRVPAGGLGPADQVRLLVDLFNVRDLDAVAAAIPAGFVQDMRPTGIPDMEVYRGPDEYRRFLEQWLDAFPDAHLEIESIETAGENVFAVVRQEMSGASGGVPVTFRYAAVAAFSDGVATLTEFHTDLDRARERFTQVAEEADG